MEEKRDAPARRRLLQSGAALVGGALGIGGAAAAASPAPSEGPPGGGLRFVGRRRPQALAAKGTKAAPTAAGFGDLTDAASGRRMGTLHTSGLGQAAPLHGLPGAPALELQTFVLPEGTLFGLGAASGRGGERTCAVLGGTGRFASAQGTYVERPASGSARGRVEFVFSLRA